MINHSPLFSQLSKVAQDWANKLSYKCKMEHRPHNQWPRKARAENLAGSCRSNPPGSDPVQLWKKSPGHNRNVSSL